MIWNGNRVQAQALDPFIPAAVMQLYDAPVELYLTGSRFFGGCNQFSDWDFFTQDTQVTKEALATLGWTEISEPAYNADPSVAAVFLDPSENVHVQLMTDVDKKKHAQAFIARHFSFPSYTKLQRKQIWRAIMEIM